MRISEFSNKTNLTKRTLQYYDEIGLLVPNKLSNGYREYNENQLKLVENIKFLRELDYSLEDIRVLLDTGIDRAFLVEKQIHYLEEQILQIRKKINTLKEKKEGDFRVENENIKMKYKKEVEERWGNTNEYKQSRRKTSKYTKADWDKIMNEQKDIYDRLAKFNDYKLIEVKELVNEWQNHITRYYYDCSDKILLGLADMYVEDDRFIKNLAKTRVGFADFLSNAIKFHFSE